MKEVSNLQEITIDYLQQSNVKMAFSGEDFAVLGDFADVPRFWSAHLNFFVLVFCNKGKVSFVVNHNQDEVSAGQFYVFLPDSVVSDIMISPDFEGKAVFMTGRLVQALLRTHIETWNRALYVRKMHKFPMETWNAEDVTYYARTYQLLAREQERPFAHEIVASILQAFLYEICSVFSLCEKTEENEYGTDDNGTGIQSRVIFQDFIAMLHQEHVKRHSISYYAAKLNISPKYLAAIVKKESGKTVRQWILEYVNADLTYYLFSTTYSIKEISSRMGFSNLSFFGRYVKTHLGLSPRALRKAARHGHDSIEEHLTQETV